MIDPEDGPAHNESAEDAPCYAPRGDFLIGLAQEALSFTKRRKLEKEIAMIKSALKGHDNKPTPRRAEQLKTRLDKLKEELNSPP
jgi:chaperonin cofactor prefoldin